MGDGIRDNIYGIGHGDVIWDVEWQRFQDNVFVSGSQDRTLCLWDVRRNTGIVSEMRMPSGVCSVNWHPKKAHLVSAGLENGHVLCYDTRNVKEPLNGQVSGFVDE